MGTGLKWPEHEADYSLPSTVEFESGWSYTPLPPICLRGIDKDNFIKARIFNTERLISVLLGFRLRGQRF
jgi:hypothetical protein